MSDLILYHNNFLYITFLLVHMHLDCAENVPGRNYQSDKLTLTQPSALSNQIRNFDRGHFRRNPNAYVPIIMFNCCK